MALNLLHTESSPDVYSLAGSILFFSQCFAKANCATKCNFLYLTRSTAPKNLFNYFFARKIDTSKNRRKHAKADSVERG